MGLLDKILGKKETKEDTTTNVNVNENAEDTSQNTLEQDIVLASEWIVKALNSAGYKADYTLESMKEIDRFFDEQNNPTGILSKNVGQILFGLGSYVGQTAIKLHGGKWITDDNDPDGEINVSVELANGSTIWPVIRCMKRYKMGPEEGIYAYVYVLDKQ